MKFAVTKLAIRGLSCVAGVALTFLSLPAQATNINVTITVDNSYALFYGTHTLATNFVGGDGNWPNAETYAFNLPASQYIYVVTASDLSTAQGFLGQFRNLDLGYSFYSDDPQWQVAATGLRNPNLPNFGAPYTGGAGDLALLSQEIVKANAGTDPSGGWVGLTSGPANGGGPWGVISGIDLAANWVWYSANGDPDPTSPGFDHDEWLIFRIQVGANPDNIPVTDDLPSVPEPGTLSILALGLLGAAATRRLKAGARNS